MNNRIAAVLIVGMMLSVSCACAYFVQEREEPDGIAPVVLIPMVYTLAGSGLGFVIGMGAGYFLWYDSDNGSTQEYLRLMAVNGTTDMVKTASSFAANSDANLAQLWGLTKEHWIRQTELESYNQWNPEVSFDSSSILEGSRQLENDALLTANAVAQFNSFTDEISDRLTETATKEAYSGKVLSGFSVDMFSFSTNGGDWDVKLTTITKVKPGDRIYIDAVNDDFMVLEDDCYNPGFVYSLGNALRIESSNGDMYELPEGKTDLLSMTSVHGNGFQSGIYTVRCSGTIAGDSIVSLAEGESVQMHAGLVMRCDGIERYVYLDGGLIYQDDPDNVHGKVCMSFRADRIPEGESNPEPVDATNVLRAYQMLLDRIAWVQSSSVSSAYAVWNIYSEADSKDYTVTTLMNSNVYDSVVLSEQMNEIMTVSAMQQLTSYYKTYGENLKNLRIGLYSDDMKAPFVRGSVIDRYGNTVYGDVIYTPFFQSGNVTMSVSTDYEVDQNVVVAVWANGQDLRQWYENGMDTDGYTTMFAGEGYILTASQIAVCDQDGMTNSPTLEFKVTKVDFIEPEKVSPIGLPDISETSGWLQIVCILMGSVSLVYGIVRRRLGFVAIGIAALAVGLFFVDDIADCLGRIGGPI